jgi:hypothetical protein
MASSAIMFRRPLLRDEIQRYRCGAVGAKQRRDRRGSGSGKALPQSGDDANRENPDATAGAPLLRLLNRRQSRDRLQVIGVPLRRSSAHCASLSRPPISPLGRVLVKTPRPLARIVMLDFHLRKLMMGITSRLGKNGLAQPLRPTHLRAERDAVVGEDAQFGSPIGEKPNSLRMLCP